MRRSRTISTLPTATERFKAWTLLMVMVVLTSGMLSDIMAALQDDGMAFVEIVESEPDSEEESELEWDDFITEYSVILPAKEKKASMAHGRENFKLVELHFDISTPPPEVM